MSALRHETALAKLPYVIEHLRDALESGEKIVCFAHHLDVIAALKAEFGAACVTLTGSTSVADRQAAVERFQNDPACTLFIGNILAAGIGITLTASSHVVCAELDWRPAMVTQAEDRTHRIGQRNAVLVQHVVFDGSLDAVMAKRIIAKQEIIDAALDKGMAEAEVEPAYAEPADMPVAAPVEAAQRVEPPSGMDITPEQSAAILAALRRLAALDPDNARVVNGVGFSKFDGPIGKSLAACAVLSPKQAALGRKIARRYRGQLGDALVAKMGA
jgi:hypothetical protein